MKKLILLAAVALAGVAGSWADGGSPALAATKPAPQFFPEDTGGGGYPYCFYSGGVVWCCSPSGCYRL
jgi:hypothetical protein